MNAKRPHFLEGFNPSASERLKVPTKFIKLMEGETTGTITLVGPSGNTWLADLVRYDDEFFIDYGWETFVRDHILGFGDSLVFRYDGHLQFTVQIFDQSLCEKESAFSAECYQDTRNFDKQLGRKRERAITDLLDISVVVPKKMRSSQVNCLSIANHQDPNLEIPGKQVYLQEDLASISERYEADEYSSGSQCCLDSSKSVTVAIPVQSRAPSGNSEASTSNKLLSPTEAERIARSFTSSFPNFSKVMKRFNVSGSYTLNIPYQFSMAHLPNCKLKLVICNVKGERWMVNSIPSTKVQTMHTFCGGWLRFVRDNNIHMGDILIFELVRSCELQVQILRVCSDELELQGGKAIYNKGFNTGSSIKKSDCVIKKMRGISQKVHLQCVTKENQGTCFSLDKAKPMSYSSKICNAESVNRKESIDSREKQGFHAMGFMSLKSAPEEKMAAQSFISNFPHFVRIMKKFNISGSYTLKVPYQFSMKHLPNCRTEIILRNLQGQCWTVNSIVTTKVQTLHTFCGGWMAFVRDNNIQIDDICIFELVGRCEMRVHISGVGKKGLDYPSGKATCNDLVLTSMINNHSLDA